MNVTKIELINFRNNSKTTFNLFTNLNIIIGKNGIGKTSVIEAIYLGSVAKSFKTKSKPCVVSGCGLKVQPCIAVKKVLAVNELEIK